MSDDVIRAIQALRRDFAAVEQIVGEVKDRSRRIETRLTRYIEAQGFETGATKPVFNTDDHAVQVPSLDASLRSIFASIPDEAAASDDPVRLILGTTEIGDITVNR